MNITTGSISKVRDKTNSSGSENAMVTALILSGGTGSRLPSGVPKQYIEVAGKPLLMYGLENMERHPGIDEIVVVAAIQWQPKILEWIREAGFLKFSGFANAGETRQESIYNGLQVMNQRGVGVDDLVIVQDAVRPCVSEALLWDVISAAREADGAMPVLPVKETIYQSEDGLGISGLLNRDILYVGQAPESFRFGKYFAAYQSLGEEKLHSLRGSSEPAYIAGMKIRMIPGSESNLKITTLEDLERFRRQMECWEGGNP